jgi:hypothetical protein
MPERILITIHHHDSNSLRLAIGSAFAICQREHCDAVLCVPSKQHAVNIAREDVLPKAAIQQMLKGTPMVMSNIRLWLESIGTLEKSGRRGAIIALYTPLKDMKIIDEMDCKAIIFLPWSKDEGEQWRSQWNPTLVPPE